MTPDFLEKRLREKVPAAIPHPDLQHRIQAGVRASREPAETHHFVRLILPVAAVLTLAALVLVATFVPRDERRVQAPGVTIPDPASPLSQLQVPVRREYDGLKSDARWSLNFVRNTLPSIPVPIKKSNR